MAAAAEAAAEAEAAAAAVYGSNPFSLTTFDSFFTVFYRSYSDFHIS